MRIRACGSVLPVSLALAAFSVAGMPGTAFSQAAQYPMGPLKPGVSFLQGDIYSRQARSAEECAELCEQEMRCRAMTFIISQQRCWIKDRIRPTALSSDMVSATKQASAATDVRILDFSVGPPFNRSERLSFDLRIKNYNSMPSTFDAYCHWKCPVGLVRSWGADVQRSAYLSPGEARNYRIDTYSVGCEPEPGIMDMTCSIDMKVSGEKKLMHSLTKQVQLP